MHMQGTPQTMQDNPTYADVVAEVSRISARSGATRWWRPALVAERICLDPGIGFGKTHEHNIDADGDTAAVSTRLVVRCWSAIRARAFWAS